MLIIEGWNGATGRRGKGEEGIGVVRIGELVKR